jgi:hydroxyacylglutathione hydrolase
MLGGHIEFNCAGDAFDWGSSYHLDERPLALAKENLLAMPGALRNFNGLYSVSDGFIILNQSHELLALAVAALVLLVAAGSALGWYLRRRKRIRNSARRRWRE